MDFSAYLLITDDVFKLSTKRDAEYDIVNHRRDLECSEDL